ncbi:MAG: hypothetical protein DSY80_01035 [Desulfocapsa sp.]|nr:MAG: hypothetical protein DSY80_01035 [Desulfocapsa sp.]
MKLSELQERIFTTLGDPDGTLYGVDSMLMQMAIETAHEAVLPRYAKPAIYEVTGDGSTTEIALPTDVYEVWAVYDTDDGIFLPKAALTPGVSWGADFLSGNAWIAYPYGSITLSDAPGEDLVIHYGAYWTVPSAADDDLEIPQSLIIPVIFYAASMCMNPEMTKAASENTHLLRTDSGNPIQNPFQETSRYFYKLFAQALARVPSNEAIYK